MIALVAGVGVGVIVFLSLFFMEKAEERKFLTVAEEFVATEASMMGLLESEQSNEAELTELVRENKERLQRLRDNRAAKRGDRGEIVERAEKAFLRWEELEKLVKMVKEGKFEAWAESSNEKLRQVGEEMKNFLNRAVEFEAKYASQDGEKKDAMLIEYSKLRAEGEALKRKYEGIGLGELLENRKSEMGEAFEVIKELK
ncbi:hypothetical protein IKF15_03180 [Candidatus Saccharibacteria bacterium]|nr:hypothetical protein [Candidatus Saccharibacteria bacterium]